MFVREERESDQLYDPQGVTVDNTTGMIYVADTGNDCVKVFDNTGKYLSRIGDSTGDGKMNYPHSLAIYENRILISHGYFWNRQIFYCQLSVRW